MIERAISRETQRRSAVARTDRLANVLDTLFRIPGTGMRFGIDPILGLIPGVGDAAGLVLSAYLIMEAARSGASRAVLLRMLFNVGVDSLLSIVPVAGDLLDAGWKANTRNLALLRRHLDDPPAAHAASRTFVVLLISGLVILFAATVISAIAVVRWLLGLL